MQRICATIAKDDGPAGLSTSATPAGSSARGGTLCDESLSDELGDLVDRRVAREARGLAVPAAAERAGDRRDVELVDTRAQRDAVNRPVVPRRLANERGELAALDRSQVVDDAFGVRLGGTHFREVGPDETRDDDASP